MLRYIYCFQYETYRDKSTDGPLAVLGESGSSSPEYHLAVYRVADKYQMPRLAEKANAVLDETIFNTHWNTHFDNDLEALQAARAWFNLVKMFADMADYSPDFVVKSNRLVQRFMRHLLKLEDFRVWLIREDNPALPCLFDAVEKNNRCKHQIIVCQDCLDTYVDQPAPGSHTCAGGRLKAWEEDEDSQITRFSYIDGVLQDDAKTSYL